MVTHIRCEKTKIPSNTNRICFTLTGKVTTAIMITGPCGLPPEKKVICNVTPKTPWAAHMGDVPMHLDYFEGSMYEMLEQAAKTHPNRINYPKWADDYEKQAAFQEKLLSNMGQGGLPPLPPFPPTKK